VTDNNDGTFDYDPPAGFTGTDTFTYTITDGNGDTSTATVTITVESADFTITKTVTGVDTAGNGLLDNPGEVIEYQIELVNTGTIDLTGVTVSDPLLQGSNGAFSGPAESISTNTVLNVGESWIYTGTYTLQQTDFDNYGGGDGDIDNTATASTNETPSQSSSATVTLTSQPGIDTTKTINNVTFDSPQEIRITYSILVENTGNMPLSNIQITDDLATAFASADSFNIVSVLPGAFTTNSSFDGDTDGGANPTHINLLAGTDSLAVGANETLTLVVLVDTGGRSDTYTNTAVAQGTPPSGPDVQDSASVPGPGFIDPAVTKAASPSQASVGDIVTFTITAFNNGNVDATGVVVTDTLPDNLDYVSATSIDTVTSLPRGTIALSPPRTVQIDIGNLATTDVIEITIVTQVNALGNPPIQNQATVTADPPPVGVSPDPTQNNASAVILQIATPSGGGGLGGVQSLPATGFAPGKITSLPGQTTDQSYTDLGDLWLEIPNLGIRTSIVGVPNAGDTWNVDWLWEQAGWLQGSAYPTWQGNSVLTGHVYLPNGLPGPFVDLSRLRWGDKIIVHAFGQRHIYEVRTNHIVVPDDLSALRHEEKAWLTLLTCKGYDENSDTYKYRIETRAVLMRIEAER